MKWSEFLDTLLAREKLVFGPYQFTPKSTRASIDRSS